MTRTITEFVLMGPQAKPFNPEYKSGEVIRVSMSNCAEFMSARLNKFGQISLHMLVPNDDESASERRFVVFKPKDIVPDSIEDNEAPYRPQFLAAVEGRLDVLFVFKLTAPPEPKL